MTVLHTTDHLVSTTLSSVKTRWCWHPQNTGKCSRRFCASAVYIFQKWRTEEGGGIWLVKLHPPPPQNPGAPQNRPKIKPIGESVKKC